MPGILSGGRTIHTRLPISARGAEPGRHGRVLRRRRQGRSERRTRGGHCQVIRLKGEELTSQCLITMEVEQGSLTMQSLGKKGGLLYMAITGVTDVYRNARGIARFWDIAMPDERVRLEILR